MNLCSRKGRHAAVLRGGWVGKRWNWKWISPTQKRKDFRYQFWLSHEIQFLLRWKKSETDQKYQVFVEFGEFPASCKDGVLYVFCFLNKSVTPVFLHQQDSASRVLRSTGMRSCMIWFQLKTMEAKKGILPKKKGIHMYHHVSTCGLWFQSLVYNYNYI